MARCLADAFLAGVWNERALVDRAGRVLDHRPAWLRPVARDVLAAYRSAPVDRPRELARLIELALGRAGAMELALGRSGASRCQLGRAAEAHGRPPRVRRWLMPEGAMGRRPWPVPEIASVRALAELLQATDGELAWMADTRGLERSVDDERLRHYRYAPRFRPDAPVRVIERPKHRLKTIQRQILHEVLDWIPAHDAAHGFTRGRSVVSHARQHTARYTVVRLDLEDFFASISAGRVFGILRTAGYPESVAFTLTGLVTNVVPAVVWQSLTRPADSRLIGAHHRLGRRLATAHLPQGAPTSPALANLAAFRLDRRLSGLAAALELTYTRYCDDLTFSGSKRLARGAGKLCLTVAEIARAEGFTVNDAKTMLATRAGRQRVCGVVVNERVNTARPDYDVLKAILHNCTVHGPASQNRAGVPDFRAHLLGRISWVAALNPARGERLRSKLAEIDWPEAS